MTVLVGIYHAKIRTDDLEVLICRFEICKQINFVRTEEENSEQTYKINMTLMQLNFRKLITGKY